MKYLLNFILFLSLVSCNRKHNEIHGEDAVQIIKVDLSKIYTGKKFPDTNHSMKVQRLESNEEYPVGIIDKVIVNKDRLYLLDRTKARALFIYSRDGKFLKLINNIGNGPGEFTSPDDFEIDRLTGNILIMDAGTRTLLTYSPEGEFLKDHKYNFMAIHFTLDRSNNIIFDKSNMPSDRVNYNLKKTDWNGSVLADYVPMDSTVINLSFNARNPLQWNQDQLYYLPPLSNCIYSLQGEEVSLAYQIDFGSQWPSTDFLSKLKGMHPLQVRNKLMEMNYVCFLNFLQTKDVLYLDFYRDNKEYSFYYNKETGQSLLIPMEEETISLPVAVAGDEFIFIKYNEKTGDPTVVFYTVNFDL